MKTWRYLQNRKYVIYLIAVRGGPSTATGNKYRKFGRAFLRHVSRQIADMLITSKPRYSRCRHSSPSVPPPGTLWTGRNVRIVFYSGLFSLLYGNMTSSTKPEVQNVSPCRQRRAEPRPQATCTENLVIFERVLFEICKRTDKQTDIQTRWSQYFAPPTWDEVTN